MTTYTNPSSLLTPTDFKLTGAAAGAFDSIKNAYAFSDMDAGIRDQDLGYLSQLQKYQNQVADQPLIDIERQNKLSAAQMDKEDWETGVNKEVYRTAKQTSLEVQKAQQSAARLNQALEGANVYSDTAELIKAAQESGMLGMQDNPEFQKHYDYYKQRAKAAGTPLPDNPFDPVQQQLIFNRATAAQRSLPEMQKRKAAMDKMIDEFTYKTDPKIQSAERINAANIEAKRELAERKEQFQRTIEAAATAILNKKGPIEETDIPILREKFSADFEKTPESQKALTMYIMGKKTDPVAQKAASASEYLAIKREEYINDKLAEAIEKHNKPTAKEPAQSSKYPTLNLNKPATGGAAKAEEAPRKGEVSGKISELGEYKGVKYRRRPDLEAQGYVIGEGPDGQPGYIKP